MPSTFLRTTQSDFLPLRLDALLVCVFENTVWNREVFGKVKTKKGGLMEGGSFWDDLEKERELALEEIEGRTKAKEDFKSWTIMEEISWRQKSKDLAERR